MGIGDWGLGIAPIPNPQYLITGDLNLLYIHKCN